ncbi:TorF family putative porin [Erythrobacter sp. BLCC-B19]|uniref:TorF family putative porin n=1 Tax=Erythrobacter sp. BLCC-B19 TaxID=3025315 RepID=UPI002362B40B|nr:TorF family putative porin [Erythrobacter sp. BLCC-B19]WDA39674.1 TorF family putative porin [Erythrobacter sp. BLCC-B19]
MFIRFASAASAVAFAACVATPAFAAEADAVTTSAADETEITVTTEEPAAGTRAIAPIDLATANGQEEEETPAITVSGSATLTSDYRFRGVSQSDEGMAVQGGFTLSHSSGFYVGTWGSNLAGWGTFGGANMELDIYAGYKLPVGEGTLDLGGTWFMYPSGADTTDFVELYAKLSGTAGPIGLTATVAYAPSQEALGNAFPVGRPPNPGDKEDNLYLAGDAVYAIADSPITLKAHIGYSDGNPGLGPNGTSIAPTGTYLDWSLGADIVPISGLTLSVAYVDTDISEAEANRIRPNFATLAGDSISDATVVFSITASF